MLHPRFTKRHGRMLLSLALASLLSILPLSLTPTTSAAAAGTASATSAAQDAQQVPTIAPGSAYRQTNLVSDLPGVARIEDPLLVNPWGISLTATSPFWVSNAGSSTSTLYRGDVGGQPLTRNPGLPSIRIPGGLPTGTVANTTNSFVFSRGSGSGPARFLFASITGNITAWNPNVPSPGSRDAFIVASHPGHVYTGLAIGATGGSNVLYAADFANGAIDVYDSSFTIISALLPGHFVDPGIPADYHPFNIQNLGGTLYVTYAKVDPVTGLDVPGAGNGYVSAFSQDGQFLRRVATQGALSSPWGLALAPASFGIFSNALLVGNFGENARINAYNPTTGAFLGTMIDESGEPVEIDELWALVFGNGGNGGDPNTLYFSAGIGEEKHGLFGSLKPTTVSATSLIQFSSDTYNVGEGDGSIQITVTRAGDVSSAATINYATFDVPGTGNASQKSDYQIALGTLRFNPGETSKSFRLFIVDDGYADGAEHLHLVLSNPTGTATGLGRPHEAVVNIADNDAANSATNPIDNAQFFVRQHYLDFLNREADPAGFQFWVNQITSCGSDATCRDIRRINVSAAFFLSIEFQQTGFLVYRAHRAAYGDLPRYGQFMRDTHTIGRDVVVGAPNWEAQLEQNKQAFFNEYVTRPEFVARYPASMTNEQFVDALLTSAGLTPAQIRTFTTTLSGAQEVPPRTTNATGTSTIRLSADFQMATVSLFFNNLSSAQTGAHIHGPAAPGVNAPILIPLPNGTFTNHQITLTAQQLQDLRNGLLYVNVHTTNFPGGEIRGQYPPAAAFRDALVAGLNNSLETRATVLRKVAEHEELREREFTTAFVLMQYFGYLRRNPEDPPDNNMNGFNFWLNKLNSFNGDFIRAEMVKAFINSGEYRQRFGAN